MSTLTRAEVNKMCDKGTELDVVLCYAWRDADRGLWPKQNLGQRKDLIEGAMQELAGLRKKAGVLS